MPTPSSPDSGIHGIVLRCPRNHSPHLLARILHLPRRDAGIDATWLDLRTREYDSSGGDYGACANDGIVQDRSSDPYQHIVFDRAAMNARVMGYGYPAANDGL